MLIKMAPEPRMVLEPARRGFLPQEAVIAATATTRAFKVRLATTATQRHQATTVAATIIKKLSLSYGYLY